MNVEQFRSIGENSTPARLINVIKDIKNGEGYIKRKLAYSAGLVLVSAVVYKGVEISMLMGLTSEPYLIKIIEKSPYVMLGGSFAADYLTSLVSGFQNLRLLENRRIGTSPNLVATSAYYASEKIIPECKTVRNILTAIMPSFISTNPFLIASALVNEQMLLNVATAKLFTTGLNVVQIAGKEVVLRTIGRKKKAESKTKGSPPLDSREGNIYPKGIVFEFAKNVKDK